MAGKTAIEWTDATVNFWWGCTKVGPGCDHCYAEGFDRRVGGAHWGVGVPRRKVKSAADLICRLNRSPTLDRRQRVFVQSMSDIFDLEVELGWFADAWAYVEGCARLDIQVVTKRVSAVEKRLAAIGRTTWPKHAGLIVTVVNQAEADRDIPRLLALKAKLDIPWVGLSCEPLLGPINLGRLPWPQGGVVDARFGLREVSADPLAVEIAPRLDWVIVGGESGPKARPMHPDWARSLRDQCVAAGVPFFFKQWGEWAPGENASREQTRTERVATYYDEGWINPGWHFGTVTVREGEELHRDDEPDVWRFGRAAAGRLLDGRTWDEFPEARAALAKEEGGR